VTPVVLISSASLLGGATLLLDLVPWFARRPLARRLAPYHPGASEFAAPRGADALVRVLGPLARAVGATAARAVGVSEDCALKLERLHVEADVTAFRLRQLGWAVVGFGAAALLTLAARPPGALALVVVVAGPLVGFLALEQRLAAASDAFRRRLFVELPVIAEQLAMLLAAGYSLGGALRRVAARGHGLAARDLRRVCQRTAHGVPALEALREWAAVAGVPSVDQLVAVLALSSEGGDLGRLLSDEARSMRHEAQRRLLADIDRKGQQVWIPVTVAALVPGVVFLAVPFVDALRMYARSG
jgi:Flp pilus assembly protein TadB